MPEISVLQAALDAMALVAEPARLAMLAAGVLMGLFLGIMPGIGGLAGMALLLPFTFTMDPYSAFAMLLGMSAVTGTSDTIPAVLFGVPGTAGAQATVMDGNPMAKNGEAGRALSAAFLASLVGGLIGALLLGLTIPVLRPLMLHIASPELLGFSLFGIAMVAVLSGSAPLRGLIAAGIGILLSMIGADPQTGTLRYTMGSFYLWDGLPIVPLVLGLFALPELADLAINRRAITETTRYDTRTGMVTGLRDVARNWWLTIRCGALGAGIGAIPGMGSSVVDWIAYGHAIQSDKDQRETYGKGQVRGVIAPESANNSITAGALVPTIAFGVPGSASMAILLGVFLIHGLVPGPDMLGENLQVTYSMVWSIALANILGAGLCFMFSGQLAKIALLRYSIILPAVLTFVYIGAFQSTRNWGDLYALLLFALIGWTMKQLRWPRPPLILGFVLGALIERYLFISFTRYGMEWLQRPLVVALLIGAALVILGPFLRHLRAVGWARGIVRNFSRPKFNASDLMYVVIIVAIGYATYVALSWPFGARIGPATVGIASLLFCTLSFANQLLTRSVLEKQAAAGEMLHDIHMDTATDFGDLSVGTRIGRGARFFGFLVLFMALMAAIGILPTVGLFVILYMRVEGKERWRLVLPMATAMMVLVYVVFDQFLRIPWPPTYLAEWFPALTVIPTL